MSDHQTPKPIFGAALLGMSFDDPDAVTEALDLLQERGVKHIDTAPRYPPVNQGQSETLLGETGAIARGFVVDSKVVLQPLSDGSGGLDVAASTLSLEKTLERLGTDQVDTLYCHRWESQIDLPQQAHFFDELYKRGRFKKLGFVGFEPHQLEQYIAICIDNDYVLPGIYQGEYNIITRGVENLIFPILRKHKIAYYGHCPLAAGFLTGRFTHGIVVGTRFADDHPLHKVFWDRYDLPALHAIVKRIEHTGQQCGGITIRDVALRWAYFHSKSGPDDGVITGCTSLAQIRENAESLGRGPLPETMWRLLEEIWVELEATRSNIL